MHADLFADEGEFTPRPAWQVIEAARRHFITGELALATTPPTNVYLRDGQVYFAERTTDGGLGVRLLVEGVISRQQMGKGAVLVSGVEHLGRMFQRDHSIDRDSVELCVELMTDDVLIAVADETVPSYRMAMYKRHANGIDRWLPTRVEVITRIVDGSQLVEPEAVIAAGPPPRRRAAAASPPAAPKIEAPKPIEPVPAAVVAEVAAPAEPVLVPAAVAQPVVPAAVVHSDVVPAAVVPAAVVHSDVAVTTLLPITGDVLDEFFVPAPVPALGPVEASELPNPGFESLQPLTGEHLVAPPSIARLASPAPTSPEPTSPEPVTPEPVTPETITAQPQANEGSGIVLAQSAVDAIMSTAIADEVAGAVRRALAAIDAAAQPSANLSPSDFSLTGEHQLTSDAAISNA